MFMAFLLSLYLARSHTADYTNREVAPANN
jgi:hypothetical protein